MRTGLVTAAAVSVIVILSALPALAIDADTSGARGGSSSGGSINVEPVDPFGDLEPDLRRSLSVEDWSKEQLEEIRERCSIISRNSGDYHVSAFDWCKKNANSF